MSKKPNKIFWLKAGLISLIGFASIQTLLLSPYRIAFETQAILKCLPQSFWLLNERVDMSKIIKGSLVKIGTENYQEFYPEGIELMKMVVAVSGDTISIHGDDFYINGQYFGGFPLKATRPPAFTGSYTLKDGEIWLSGSSETTLDSRYIGVVSINEVNAHAYAIL